MSVRFYPGLHQPSDAKRFERCCISIHRLGKRIMPLGCPDVLVDSGAFTKLAKYGGYPYGVEVYAKRLHRLHTAGTVEISAAVAEDWMCEPFMLAKTGKTVPEHQRLTVERYDALVSELRSLFDDDIPFPVMPVLQGFLPEEYSHHIGLYGARLRYGMWVGVGSVCKRNASVEDIIHVLGVIKQIRPDLRLHGFGLKKTALKDARVRAMLHTADSMAWAYHAVSEYNQRRKEFHAEHGRWPERAEVRAFCEARGMPFPDANSWRWARTFLEQVDTYAAITETEWQMALPFYAEAAE